MRTPEQRRAAILEETTALRAYRAMPQTQILIGLLDALEEDTLADLATVTPDRLLFTQGALAQVRALRVAIGTDDVHRSAKA